MKTRTLLTILTAVAMVMSCSNDLDNTGRSFSLRHYNHSGCKKSTSANSFNMGTQGEDESEWPPKELLEYEGHDNGNITLHHINASFNCAVADIQSSITLSGNTIVIDEKEVFNDGVMANCFCPYDLTFTAGPLEEGAYTIIVRKNNREFSHTSIHFSETAQGTVELVSLL